MIEAYREWLKDDGKASGTIAAYSLNIRLYKKWYLDTFGAEMTVLLHSNVLDYRSYLQNIKKLKAGTINTKLAALISLDGFLVETGQQQASAVSKKDLLRIQSAYTSPSDLTEKDVDAFRQRVLIDSGKRNHAIVTILAFAGLRISEALSLGLDDVDLIGQQITVNRGKGNKERVVFIGDKVVHAVKEYTKELKPDSRWLFPGRNGKRLDRSVINKFFNRYSDNITPHRLRHYYCSNALDKGYSFHEVAHQAGHSNIRTTLRYSNPNNEKMKEKANKL